MQLYVIFSTQMVFATSRTLAEAVGIGMLFVFLIFFLVGAFQFRRATGIRLKGGYRVRKPTIRNRKPEPLIIIEQEQRS